jgi:hypothetical protein
MSRRTQSVTHEAIIFFDGDKLVKEMLRSEFEAVLDQVVGLSDFAGREMRACFLRINQRLQVVGALFFLVDFDQHGFVNRSWNLPLSQLLDNAGRGPDLGAGRIRLGCRSQCSIPWHQRQLWDPQLEGKQSTLQQLAAAVRRNRLGLPVEREEPEVLEPPLLQEQAPPVVGRRKRGGAGDKGGSGSATYGVISQRLFEERMSEVAESHALQLAAQKAAAEEELARLHQHYQIEVAQLKASLDSTRQLFKDEKCRTAALKEKLEAQASEFRRLREQSQREMAEARGDELERLQQQFEVELKARLDQATAELREMLEMREVELFYREEQMGGLREEIARLRREREQLITRGGDQVLQQLIESGIAFVAYLPGSEVINIPVDDLPRYLESPVAYMAEQCHVTLDHYQQWSGHYDLPLCSAVLEDGSQCGELLPKVTRPNQFVPGDSDRCRLHKIGAVTPLHALSGRKP